ncbi:MAG TPA: endonuclease domain-containing protein [Phenylobacterium sp.]
MEPRPDPATITERAQELRREMSPPERLLWEQLKGRQLEGYKFRRQHPFDPYVLDFYCVQEKLAIEVDGLGHSMGDQPMRDARKDGFLKHHGVRVLRFSAEDCFRDMDSVVRTILATLGE